VASLNGREAVVHSAGGLRLLVPAQGVAPGGRLRVAIRPESLHVLGDGAAYPNTVPAQVEEVIYLGDVIKVVLRATPQETLVVKQANRKGLRPPDPGSRVQVGWAVEDGRVLVADPADG